MKNIIFIILSLLPFILYSQNYLKISGKVSDAQTGKYLQYVNVYFNDLKIGTVTNSQGEYILHVKKNNSLDTLNFTYIGYYGENFCVDKSIDSMTVNIKLKQKINKLKALDVIDKKPDPEKILKNTYNFLKKHQNKTYDVKHYTRVYLKYNDRFIYGGKGFFDGCININKKKVNLWYKNFPISRDIKTNDSLLYSRNIPQVLFRAMSTIDPIKKIRKLLRKANIKIDTVILYENSKLYVLNVDYNFNNTLPANYDMIVNTDLIKIVSNQINNKKEEYSYKLYIEVKNDKYILNRIDKIITSQPEGFNSYLYKKEYYYKTLKDYSIIPNYQSSLEAYISDTAKYYIFNDYIITKYDTVNTINETYTCIDYFFPRYDQTIREAYSEKEKNEAKSVIKKAIHNIKKPNFNYIKEDTLELILNQDLK